MLVYSSGLLPTLVSDVDLLMFICLSGLLGSLVLLPMVVVSNRYVALGCIRQLRAMIVADIGLESSLVLLAMLLLTVDAGSDHLVSRSLGVTCAVMVFTVPFILVLVASARAPFDMPEAESELVAGSLTELGGTVFSFCLLIDYFEILT